MSSLQHTTSNITSMAAADAALATTELLEHVLSFCDAPFLARARRVSRHWSNVVAGSTKVVFMGDDTEQEKLELVRNPMIPADRKSIAGFLRPYCRAVPTV
jgi:hypothetical protein